ncbi:hypothetical protein CPT_Melville_057 [Salmonella phage Melville]|uniref:Uncharacterized protein n=2 Tax=Gelderlandvirus TaxID=1913653 RepID=A0A2D1GM85_9CAUD|nr:hypothetical protein STP4a_058 [Salmonella phage STP4-a]YP_009615543.1 hypothetical protein FDI73_gp057 [Salmonella phage Melville]AHJ86913.1 hypothetical protein STP4a_058 [Salmonella phage STP4-a]ATN93031.1 hypothetical protein CPT_Melville_057 [Salmonella phage Melville]UFK27185.1 hypothetical protein LG358_00164 [Escherichia phage UoN_LG358_1]
MNKEQIVADLELAGFDASVEDGRLMIEGTSKNGVGYVIEEDFDAWWLYEYTGKDYHSVDAFSSMDKALEAAKELVL